MIAWDRFVGKVPYASVLIMVTYHLARRAWRFRSSGRAPPQAQRFPAVVAGCR